MRRRTSTSVRAGLTLIEILIVVVILGILVAMVIPRFSDATQEAAASSIKTTLQTVRGQIELYRMHNGGTPPASIADLVDADREYISKDPNDSVPSGFEYQYDAVTGHFSVACTIDHPDCPSDIDEW